MIRWLLALLVFAGGVVLAVAGVRADGFSASVRVVVRADENGELLRSTRIECDSRTTSPSCARLATLERSDFAPTPPDVPCTRLYGGPAVATVRGTLRGTRLDARFHRRGGCAIARWERFSWLLGDAPRLRP